MFISERALIAALYAFLAVIAGWLAILFLANLWEYKPLEIDIEANYTSRAVTA